MRIRALPFLSLLCAIALAFTALPAIAAAQEGQRIVAVGDVHGDFDGLVDILSATGLIDGDLAWTGGSSVLVQTGDLLDGKSRVRDVLDLMMRLQTEAREAGGDVVVLLGDHEVLSILGELRDVSPETLATFAVDNQEAYLQEAFAEFVQAYLRMEAGYQQANRSQKEDLRDKWVGDQATGRVEYMRAMGPDGEYGRWLRTLPVNATVDGVLFMHANVAPQLAAFSMEDINQRLALEIDTLDASRAHLLSQGFITSFSDVRETIRAIEFDARGLDWFEQPREMLNRPPALPENFAAEDRFGRSEPILRINGWFMLAPRGPIWSESYATAPDGLIDAQLPGLLEASASRLVVAAHVPTEDGRVRVRGGGSLILIDTGMAQGGQASALVIQGDSVEAVYADGSREALGSN